MSTFDAPFRQITSEANTFSDAHAKEGIPWPSLCTVVFIPLDNYLFLFYFILLVPVLFCTPFNISSFLLLVKIIRTCWRTFMLL